MNITIRALRARWSSRVFRPLVAALLIAGAGVLAPLAPGAHADQPVAVAGPSTFGWPLAPPHPVLRQFEAPATPYGPGHRGVDLGGTAGEAVLAAGDGLVLYAGPLAGRSVVSLEHPDGLRTSYEPVRPAVAVGQSVRRGQVIGFLLAGHPGCPAGQVCLHWGVHREKEYLDPLRLVTGQVRLLPWPADLAS